MVRRINNKNENLIVYGRALVNSELKYKMIYSVGSINSKEENYVIKNLFSS